MYLYPKVLQVAGTPRWVFDVVAPLMLICGTLDLDALARSLGGVGIGLVSEVSYCCAGAQ